MFSALKATGFYNEAPTQNQTFGNVVSPKAGVWPLPGGVFLGYMDSYKEGRILLGPEEFSNFFGVRYKVMCAYFNSGAV